MAPRRRLLWQLYPSYLLLVLIAVAGATWYASRSLKEFFLERISVDLQERARLISPQVKPLLDPLDEKGVQRLCSSIGAGAATRITVVLASGRVVGDTNEDPRRMENHADRPEFRAALTDGLGRSMRYSRTLDKDLMYVGVGVPIAVNGPTAAVVRTAIPVDGVDRAVANVQRRIAFAGLFFAVAAGFVGLVTSSWITRPLEHIRKYAEKLSGGDFQAGFSTEGCAEIQDVADSMKKMAVELRKRIDTITGQRNRTDAILSTMAEGVIAVDTEERVILLNQAAAGMLDRRGSDATGRSIQEVTRNTAVYEHIEEVLNGEGKSTGEVRMSEGLVVEAYGTELLDSAGVRIGALLVLKDVSDLRKLERVRRDFVANVSHELKTPVTAIKGFVETLVDGGIEDKNEAARFLGIIERHVNRLDVLIDDLMVLAKIEQNGGNANIELSPKPLRGVIETAVQMCAAAAAEKNISLEIFCPENLSISMDPFLMEQALVNLVDNAIKYSGEGSPVQIRATAAEDSVSVSVEDRGCGIRREHLPRIFERFYRVDKARSRAQGGTGLGLAIVKHIVQAHRGRIDVVSSPGKGSTFFMVFPSPV